VLLNYHNGRLVLSSLCVGDLVRLVLGGVRFAGWSLQNEHHPEPTITMMHGPINIRYTYRLHPRQYTPYVSALKLIETSEMCETAKGAFEKYMRSIWPHISTHILFGMIKVTNDHVHDFSHTEIWNSIIRQTSSDATCHFVSVPKYSARLSTPVTTQNNNNNNNFSSASCGWKPSIRHFTYSCGQVSCVEECDA